MNKRDCSRLKDTKRTKQPFAVCGSGLDPCLNNPDVKDLKTNCKNLNTDLSVGLY